jgi:hypothetical protein
MAKGDCAMTPYRVFVSTDLGGDPDDIQSLCRIIHFSDLCRIEGIASVVGPDGKNSADSIRHWIQRVDVDQLRANGLVNLQTEAELLACVRQGATVPGAPCARRRTGGSQILIDCANVPAGRPLWVLAWGSLTDIAQALHDDPGIAPKIRQNCISSSNTEADPASRDFVHDFMVNYYPELWWIENGRLPKWSGETFRGVYDGGCQEGIYHNKGFITAFTGWPAREFLHADGNTVTLIYTPVRHPDAAGHGNPAKTHFATTSVSDMTSVSNKRIVVEPSAGIEYRHAILKDATEWKWYYSLQNSDGAVDVIRAALRPLAYRHQFLDYPARNSGNQPLVSSGSPFPHRALWDGCEFIPKVLFSHPLPEVRCCRDGGDG